MHEFGIMQEMARIAVEKAEAAGADRVHVIRLRVGRLAGVVPEAMQFAHEVVVEGTIAEGSTLEIEEAPARCYCAACDEEFEPGREWFTCPRCGAISRELRSGRELELVNLEVS
jgi:hydrogenase nickel incorporation protein HypA/HybF